MTLFSQLQQDLILVFRNCVDFNGKDTEFGTIFHTTVGTVESRVLERLQNEGCQTSP
jgi:hypothetical protein